MTYTFEIVDEETEETVEEDSNADAMCSVV